MRFMRFVGFTGIFLLFFIFTFCSKDNPVNPPSNTDPIITSLSNIHGIVGNQIEINGSGFGTTQDTGYVEFGGIKTLQSDITQWTDSKIKTKIPVGAKTGRLYVCCKATKSNSMDFTVDSLVAGAPYIDNIIPASFKEGDIVEINGQNFGNAQAAGFVDFATLRPNDNDYVLWTDTKIKVKAPAVKAAGVLYVFQNNKKSNLYTYTVIGAPKITNISPNPAEWGKEITISGDNFGDSRLIPNLYFVNFLGFKPDDSDYTVWSKTQIKVKVPVSVWSPCDVTVSLNGYVSNKYTIIVKQPTPAPVIASINPSSAFAGETLTITGTNFGDPRGSNFVTFNGSQAGANDYLTWTDTQITIKVPTNATTGLVKVAVNSQYSNGVNFTLLLPQDLDPQIEYLTPDHAQEGQVLEIAGKNFANTRGTNYVTFNGLKPADGDYSSWADKSIKVKVPVGATSGDVVVHIGTKSSNAVTLTVQEKNYIVTCLVVPKGSFVMGSNFKPTVYPEELPTHTVNISQDFYMSTTEISQKVWKTVMDGSNPSKFSDDDSPVNQVTWIRAVTFCNTLSTLVGLTPCYTINGNDATCDFNATGFRLPTEAEWEYACRAGTTGNYAGTMTSLAWYIDNSNGEIKHVGTRQANAFGLMDMHGNVAEWCWDWYDPEYYASSPADNPKGPASGSGKVVRGGTFRDAVTDCRSARRDSRDVTYVDDNIGFRVVRKK